MEALHNTSNETESLTENIQEVSDEEMTIDWILEKTRFGLSQVVLLIVFCLINCSYAYQALIMYYAGNSPPWKCVSNTSGFCATNYGKEFDSSSDDFTKRCGMKRSEWQYTTQKDYSIVTEYELVCSREYLNALINASFFIGWGLCGLFTGIFSDKYGRKIVMVLSLFAVCLFAILSSFVNSLWQLGILRAILGGAVGSITSSLYIYASEITPPKYRSVTMNIVQIQYSISLILLSVLAMYLKDWRNLELYAAIPSAFTFMIVMFLPESPRWLLIVGRVNEAEMVLRRLLHSNNCKLIFHLDTDTVEKGCKTKYSYIDLFRKCSIICFVLAQALAWFTSSLVYYGLSLESSDLGGNIYENFMLSMISDILGTLSAIFVCNRFGRKKTTIVSLAMCGIILGCIGAVPKLVNHATVIRIGLAMAGKVFVNISFSCLYIWSAELYPTVVRTQGITICQIAARIGSAASPFLTGTLKHFYEPLAFVTMSSLTILASVIAFVLPETYKTPTREQFEDILTPRQDHVYDRKYENKI